MRRLNVSFTQQVECKMHGIPSQRKIRALGGDIRTTEEVTMLPEGKHIPAVMINDERIEVSDVVWTAPINLAAKQLQQPSADLDYLGLLLFNVMVENDQLFEIINGVTMAKRSIDQSSFDAQVSLSRYLSTKYCGILL